VVSGINSFAEKGNRQSITVTNNQRYCRSPAIAKLISRAIRGLKPKIGQPSPWLIELISQEHVSLVYYQQMMETFIICLR
jgi:hypothetical protein